MPLVAPTIYLDRDTRASEFGNQLLGAIRTITEPLKRKMAYEHAQTLPEDQQASYLAEKLGPEGLDFVKSLAQIQASKASIARSNALTQTAITQNQLDQKKLAGYDREQALADDLTRARMTEARASAAGSYARANAAQQEVGLKAAQLKMEQEHNAIADAVSLENLKQLRQEQEMSNQLLRGIPGLNLGGGTQGGQGPSTGTIQPQSFTPGAGSPAPTLQPIAGGTIVPQAGGSASDETSQGSSQESPAARLQLIDQVDRGGDAAGSAAPQIALTPAQKMEIAGKLAKRDIAGAGDALQKSQMPSQVMDIEIAPGITVKTGLYGDGRTRPIPGTTQDKRKPADQNLREEATGASLWYQTSQILKSLGDADPSGSGGDVLGSAAIRRLNSVLQNHGLEPIGDSKTRDVREAYQTIYEHNIFGINSLMRGTRPTQQLRNQLQATAPKPTDTKEIRDQKIKATQLTAAVIIKGEVETAIEGGMKVPPNLLAIYKNLNLQNTDLGTLQKDYLATFKALGVTDPQIDFTPTGGDTGAGGTSGGAGGTSGGSSSGDSGGGWSVQRIK